MIQENSSNRQENIVAGDNSQLQFLSAVEEFKRAETDEEKAVAIEAMRIVANTGNKGLRRSCKMVSSGSRTRTYGSHFQIR